MNKTVANDRPLDLVNATFLTLTPVIAVLGTIWYVWNNGVTWLEISTCIALFMLSGMAITMGYHRYYSHRTYDCNRFLQLYYLVFGASAVQNSVLNWASDHRYHHRFVDQEEDPYNILKGGLYAHIGWIFYKDTRQIHQKYKNIPDLLRDPLLHWQDRWYLALVVLVTFALPTFIGFLDGRPMGGLLWGGFVRVVIVHHMTFFINSLAHLYGARPYSLEDTARDSWLLGPFSFGEGYHNFHHKFQYDYRNGIRWYHVDIAKWALFIFKPMGWVWNLRRTPDSLILKARLEVEAKQVQSRLAAASAPDRKWELIDARMKIVRERLETAMAQYQAAKVEYGHRKAQWSVEARRQWAEKISEYQDEYNEAMKRWRSFVRAMNRIPQPSAHSLFTLTAVLDLLKYRLF